MISNPRPGERVLLHYSAKKRSIAPYHGRAGVVVTPGKRRPRNHLVRLGDELAIVPAGNLAKPKETA